MNNIVKSKVSLWLMFAAVLLLVLAPAVCLAGKPGSATDSDKRDTDGFIEGSGLTVWTDANTAWTLPACKSGTLSPDRDSCVDPSTQDLFVIVWPASTNFLLPAGDDPLEYLKTTATSSQGLNIGIHTLPRGTDLATRYLLSSSLNYGQMASRVQENNTLTCEQNGNLFGLTSVVGTPNDGDNSTVYTACIKEWVTNHSTGATAVYLNSDTTEDYLGNLDYIIDVYVKQTIAHEIGHSMALTTTSNPAYNGNHYAPGTGSIMDQYPVVRTNADGSVTWFIPTGWISSDVSGVRFK